MRMIKELACKIKEELDGAKCYAEDYIEAKVENSEFAKTYKTMSEQELQHANYLKDIMTKEVYKAKQVITLNDETLEFCDKFNKKYLEKVAKIKIILQM